MLSNRRVTCQKVMVFPRCVKKSGPRIRTGSISRPAPCPQAGDGGRERAPNRPFLPAPALPLAAPEQRWRASRQEFLRWQGCC